MSLALARQLDSDSLAQAQQDDAKAPEVSDEQAAAALKASGLAPNLTLAKITGTRTFGRYIAPKTLEMDATRNAHYAVLLEEVMEVAREQAQDPDNDPTIRLAAVDSVSRGIMSHMAIVQLDMKLAEVHGKGSSRKRQKTLAPQVFIHNTVHTDGSSQPVLTDAKIVE